MQTTSVACGAATPEEFVRQVDYFSRNLEAVRTDMTLEGIVVEEVVRYFADPKFQKFSIKEECPIQIGSYNGRADVVLIDSEDNLVAVAECKRVGGNGQGLDQLKSYLSATDTRFGIFANDTNPAVWDFYENLGRNQVRRMTRAEFEERVVNGKNNRNQPDSQSVRSGSVKHFVDTGGNMEKALTIRPTLYIGLGTTGTEILDNLRDRNFQEYGRAGLPIFRYVSIETDRGNTGKLSSIDAAERVEFGSSDEDEEDSVPRILRSGLAPQSYERNRVIHTTISDRETIRGQIDSSNLLSFNEHLADWLDERILDSAAVKFGGGGAGNIRMAGRLALWENWNKDGKSVKPILLTAYKAIQEQPARDSAKDFLDRHFGHAVEVDPKTRNIFIVGTLCGGTCSGMLLDIAYYFRHIGNADTKIYGLFTMYNEDLALGGDPGILLANCYASLVELDFYNRRETAYEITLPDKTSICDTGEPFNVATFFSPTNMETWSCTTDGHFDLAQLNRMVATDLFVRSVGVESLIEADLVNAPARDSRFGKVRNVGDTPGKSAFVQHMFSSGVTDIWLPKEQIVKGAVGEIIQNLSRTWSNSQPAPGSPKAETLVPTGIVGDIEGALLKPDGGAQAFDTRLQEDLTPINAANNQDSAQASNLAIACLNYLNPHAGGKYYHEFDAKSAIYCGQYRANLKEAAKSFKGCSQLFPQREFLNAVHGLIQSKLEDLEDDSSDGLKIQQIVDEAADDNTTVVPKKGFFGSEKSGFNLERFKGRIADEQRKLSKKFVTFFVGETLRGIQRDLTELRQEVDAEIEHIQAKFTQSLLSAGNPRSSIKNAAEDLSALTHRSDELSSPENLEYLLNYIRDEEPDSFCFLVRGKLRDPFNRHASRLIRGFQFDDEAGRRSSPYQEFTVDYENYRLNLGEPGGDARMFRYLVAAADDSSLRAEAQAKFEEAFIPNLRVFYQMEAGYALDDIRVVSYLRSAYENALSEYTVHDGYPVHIHKDPDKFSESAILRAIQESQEEGEINRRLEEVQKDVKALEELWNYAREENGNLFQYLSSGGSGDLTIEVRGVDGFLRKFDITDESELRDLAADSGAAAEFTTRTRAEFGSMEEAGSFARCIDRLHSETVVNRKESDKFYREYIALLRKHRAGDQG